MNSSNTRLNLTDWEGLQIFPEIRKIGAKPG